MILNNLRVTVTGFRDASLELSTEQGASITIPRHLVGELKNGETLYLAADTKPLVEAGQHAKDILNEIIGGGSGT